jgi:hypothetical protein
VNNNKEREVACCYFYININVIYKRQMFNTDDRSVAVHNKCSKIPQSSSVQFATRVRRSRVVRLS